MTALRRVQLSAAALHGAVVLAIVCWIVFVSDPHDHMWSLVWFVILFWADLPASALFILLVQALPASLELGFARSLGYVHPFHDLSNFWLPLLCYGAVGTLWWYWLPAWIAWVARLRVTKSEGR